MQAVEVFVERVRLLAIRLVRVGRVEDRDDVTGRQIEQADPVASRPLHADDRSGVVDALQGLLVHASGFAGFHCSGPVTGVPQGEGRYAA